ncbi:hypothetical protein [Ramlibacter sp.]|jgi:hypothetical protein|uniref:hypothetical protein n=1 Tax=Ramlibacter sp. TaxID=1917967 RepID=UPI0026205ADA|nr:hypothetical protein [Ramlibacter sp.]
MGESKQRAKKKIPVHTQGGTLPPTQRLDAFSMLLKVHDTPADQRAAPLLRKFGRALSRPGISRQAVFGLNPSPRFFVYSVDPVNPDRLIRENCEGHKEVGRMVNGRFRKARDVA